MENKVIDHSLFFLPTNVHEIANVALSIKSKSSTGYDDISNKLVKLIIPNIVEPLEHIYNKSLLTGVFPDPFKIAKVIPIFKSGDKHDSNNYRPISLLPAFSNIFEKILYKRLIQFYLKTEHLTPSPIRLSQRPLYRTCHT